SMWSLPPPWTTASFPRLWTTWRSERKNIAAYLRKKKARDETVVLDGFQGNSALADLILEDLVFDAEAVDDLLLLPVHPAGKDNEEKLQGPENEIHGRSDATEGKTNSIGDQSGPANRLTRLNSKSR